MMAPPARRDRLLACLGHDFTTPALLDSALTHPSALPRGHRAPRGADWSFEQLEFLGDRVLGLVVADLLMRRFPKEEEGALARRHAALVRKEALRVVSDAIDLANHLRRAEDNHALSDEASTVTDACEAVIAALYLDGGLEPAARFITRYWEPLLEADLTPPKDAKTSLQEWAQGRGLPLPEYKVVTTSGPAHAPTFEVSVSLPGHGPALGGGRSKRAAEQDAATQLLAVVAGKGPSDGA